MIKTAKAAIFREPGQPLQIEEFELPTPKEQEILVRVACSTICGSDVHSFTGNRSTPCPTVLGHEILGRVVRFGSNDIVFDIQGDPVKIGDRITWSVAASCGMCFYCQNELPQKCTSLFKYGHESIEKTNPFNGGLAEYCLLVPGTPILKVPEGLSDTLVTPVNCATATVSAAFRLAGDCKDQSILIQGAGMLGLTASAMARSRGARDVITTDVSDERLELAKQFGATETVNVSQGSDALRDVVNKCTDGRGVDIAIELCGVNESVQNCLDRLRIGGTCILVGSTFPTEPIPISIESLVRGIKRLQGIHNYTPQDLVYALNFLEKFGAQYPFESMVGKIFSLEEAAAAMDYAIHNPVLRVAVVPGHGK
jgi:putative phosphonate catabolism associated alcohol dehydrogenase